MAYRLRRKQPTRLKENLQSLMKARRIKSGSDLARQLDIPPPSVNRLVSGQVIDPRSSTLVLLADYFGVTLDELIGRAPSSSEGS